MKTVVDDGFVPWAPVAVKSEVDSVGSASAEDDVDHIPLKDRLRLLLAARHSGSSLGFKSSGTVPACHAQVVVKKEACFIEALMIFIADYLGLGENGEKPWKRALHGGF
ncbi:hypothetical protein ACLOJK_007162 [Asimina triloba]